MKSKIIQEADFIPEDEKECYSDLQVLRSAAGFFIGTIYTDKQGLSEMGSRDSEYFETREQAQTALDNER